MLAPMLTGLVAFALASLGAQASSNRESSRPFARVTVPSANGCGYLVIRGATFEWHQGRGDLVEGWRATLVGDARPRVGERVVTEVRGPGSVRVVQQPCAENDLTTILVIPDPEVTWSGGDRWSLAHVAGATRVIQLRLVVASPRDADAGASRAAQLAAWQSLALQAKSAAERARARAAYLDLHQSMHFEATDADRAKAQALLDEGVRSFYGDDGMLIVGDSVMLLWPRDYAAHPSVREFLAQLDLAYAALVDLAGQNPNAIYGHRFALFFMQGGAAWFNHHVGMGRAEFAKHPPFNTVYFHEMGHDFFKYPTDLIVPESAWGEGVASFAQFRALEAIGFDRGGLRRVFDEGERLLSEHLAQERPLGDTGAYFMGATTYGSFGVKLATDGSDIEWDWDAYRALMRRFRALADAPVSKRDRYRHFAATLAQTFGPGVYDRFERVGYPVARDDPRMVEIEQREVLPALRAARESADKSAVAELEALALRRDHRLRGEVQRLLVETKMRHGDAAGALSAAQPLGIVRDWWIHDPIAAPAENAIDFETDVESAIGAASSAVTVGGRVVREWTRALRPSTRDRWQIDASGFRQHRAKSPDGIVDLNATLGASGDRVQITYAVAVLDSERPQRVELRVGHDDDCVVFLNGEVIERVPAYATVRPDSTSAVLPLRAGSNLLVLKVVNRAGAWGFTARLVGDDGLAAADVRLGTLQASTKGPRRGGSVWTIGAENGASNDLAPWDAAKPWQHQFPVHVTFDPASDDARKRFPEIQPGPNDAWADSRTHTFAIGFRLDATAATEHELTISTLGQNGYTPPRLRVAVNGVETSFRLPGCSDDVLRDRTRGLPCRLRLQLGAGTLRHGANRIELSIPDGSWVIYDAITLCRLRR